MNAPLLVPPKRCAVYCRVSSDERLDQSFNSIDAQKEAGHAFIQSQACEGWIAVGDDYDDGGFSGGNMDLHIDLKAAPPHGLQLFQRVFIPVDAAIPVDDHHRHVTVVAGQSHLNS